MYYYIIIIIRYEFIKGNDINFQNWGEKYHDFTINDKINSEINESVSKMC